MNKIFIMGVSAIAMLALHGAEANSVARGKIPAGMTVKEYLINKNYGGTFLKPNSGKGLVYIHNQQNRLPATSLSKVIKEITSETRVLVQMGRENKASEMKIDVVDVATQPTLTILPDSSSAIVNVATLSDGSPSEDVLSARVRKNILRAFSYLAGNASSSSCESTLMDAMTSLDRLDSAKERLPGELSLRGTKYLARLGIVPYTKVTYKQACQEGWASQPTNEFQRAIWDQVHETPSEPMKITFDPATDKK